MAFDEKIEEIQKNPWESTIKNKVLVQVMPLIMEMRQEILAMAEKIEFLEAENTTLEQQIKESRNELFTTNPWS